MPNNLLHVEPHGFNLIPPETTQRFWVPREALTSVQVLGVIGGRAAAAMKRAKAPTKDQIGSSNPLSSSEQTQSERLRQARPRRFCARSQRHRIQRDR